MKRKAHIILLVLLLLCVLSTTAFAIDESEVESAIAASSKEEVAGNVFIWFLCAIGFLKVSQKIDSFMASLGINVGRTGGSMLTELMVAGRGIAAVAGAVGGTVFNHHPQVTALTQMHRPPALLLQVEETALSALRDVLLETRQPQALQAMQKDSAILWVALCSNQACKMEANLQ